MTKLNDNIKALAQARLEVTIAESHVRNIEKEIDELYGERLSRYRDALRAAKKDEKEAYGEVSSISIDKYLETRQKRPHAAVGVGEYTVLDYSDAQAIDWLIEKQFPGALKLNKRAFEKIAKAARPEFVSFIIELRARVDTNLEKYLAEEQPTEFISHSEADNERTTL